jgi:hypothetical protein
VVVVVELEVQALPAVKPLKAVQVQETAELV